MVATALPDGYAQVSPRGSTTVYDDEHLALRERGHGSTTENLRDGSKVTVFFRKPAAHGRRPAERRHRPVLRHGDDP
jgi:hypothetical protein